MRSTANRHLSFSLQRVGEMRMLPVPSPRTFGSWSAHGGGSDLDSIVLVGHVAYLGRGGGGQAWHCRTCDAVVYGAPVSKHLLHWPSRAVSKSLPERASSG